MPHHAAAYSSPSLQQGRVIRRLEGLWGKERPLPLHMVSPNSSDICPKVLILSWSLMMLCLFIISGFWHTVVHYKSLLPIGCNYRLKVPKVMLSLKKAKKKYLPWCVVVWKGHLFSASVMDLYLALASHCQDSNRGRNTFLQHRHKDLMSSSLNIVTESFKSSSLLAGVITAKGLTWSSAGCAEPWCRRPRTGKLGCTVVWWLHGGLSFRSQSLYDWHNK